MLLFFFARTEHAPCRRVKMKKPYYKSSVLWGEHITYSWQYMKGRLQEGKENTQNCSFRMTLISANSHINTETLQNKQLYSNQDAIYREQTATLH